ncbi:MAG: hypothetical protein APF80_10275 [Alphaproteobacteria bacterium BRH_c36]|nr:MAG: hypothetical protein APF80_10275 [Alphaproteobacteria bacterium BRH_c36]
MCAQVLKFRSIKADSVSGGKPAGEKTGDQRSGPVSTADSSAQQFWIGASGARYIHTIHSLLYCPELPAVNYLLVRRDSLGVQTVLAAGHTAHYAPSLNLAEIRRHGATLGANEVHVHMLADNVSSAKVIEQDLKAAQLAGTLPPASSSKH